MAKSSIHPGMARRTGTIFVFDSIDQRRAFQSAHARGVDLPVPIRDEAGKLIGTGRLIAAYAKGNELIGTVVWPEEVERAIGSGQPGIALDLSRDGSICKVMASLEDEENSEEESSEGEEEDSSHDLPIISSNKPPESGKSKAMAKFSFSPDDSVEDIFERLLTKFDNDPLRAGKAALSLVKSRDLKIKDLEKGVLPENHVAIPKADAAMIEVVKALGDPKELKTSLETLAKYRELGDSPEKVKKAIEDGSGAVVKLSALEWDKTLDDQAEKFGFHGSGAKVFKSLVKPGTEFVEAKSKDPKTGKDVTTYSAKFKAVDGTEVVKTLEELEAEDWAPYVPALRPDAKVTVRQTESTSGYRESNRAMNPNLQNQGQNSNARGNSRESQQPQTMEDAAKSFLIGQDSFNGI